jgi:hypothetical protein
MEIQDNLTAADTGIPGGAVADTLASAVKNLAAGIRNKAKAKSAQKASDAGNYWTLRAFLKSLIKIPQYILDQVGGQGITEYAVLNLPAQSTGGTTQGVIDQLKKLSGQNVTTVGAGGVIGTVPAASEEKTLAPDPITTVKKYIPYIVGAILLGVVIYFIIKHK